MSRPGGEAHYWAGRLISGAGRRLQTDPEEVLHPRRQIEGGNVARHVEQLQAEVRHDVADDDYDQEHLRRDPQSRTRATWAVRTVAINNGNRGKAASTSTGWSRSPAVTRSAAPKAGSW